MAKKDKDIELLSMKLQTLTAGQTQQSFKESGNIFESFLVS